MITRERRCDVCQNWRKCWHTGMRWLCGDCWNSLYPPEGRAA